MTKSKNGVSETLLTPAEVADLFYVDPKTVTRWARAGKLHALVTPGGHRRFLEAEVLAVREGGFDSQPEVAVAADASPVISSQPDGVAFSARSTVAAVAAAAERVAHAAETSRMVAAREAQVAAEATASQAALAAAAVRQRADLLAEHIAAAVSLAAEIVAAAPQAGSHAEATKTAKRVAVVANNAAVAAAEETVLAATNVAEAVSEAAAEVAAQVCAAATAFDLKFAEAAIALQEAATATARQAANDSNADVGVALPSYVEVSVKETVPPILSLAREPSS